MNTYNFLIKNFLLFSDPSLFYKNIPKTILLNLSKFFDKHRSGVKFNELLTLYCVI